LARVRSLVPNARFDVYDKKRQVRVGPVGCGTVASACVPARVCCPGVHMH
jgi:hypothetical protein